MVRILIGLLAAVVIAAGVGWWVSTHSDAPARFESCHVKDGVQVRSTTSPAPGIA